MTRSNVARFLFVGIVSLAGCSDPPAAVDSAVLITIDTWRADRFGAGGHPDVRTPHLDRFFRGGTQFLDTYAPVPTTLASHASMLTGEWPSGHGVARNGWPVPEDVTTLAELLRERGFATAAFVSSAALHPDFRLDQGFDVYDYSAPVQVARDQDWRPARDTLAPAMSWWRRTPAPRFLWVHVFEPHFPYDPDPHDLALYERAYDGPADGSMDFLFSLWADPALGTKEATDHLEALYHAEITGVDRALGAFLADLAQETGTLTVLTSDHGESLGEHGLNFKHGIHVFPSDVKVPMVVRGVAPFGPGLTEAMVRTVDVTPTILGRLGVSASLPPDAADLADWVDGGVGLPVFAEASMPWNVEEEGVYANAHKQRAVRTSEWSYVETPWRDQQEWFDRDRDPAELEAVPGPDPATRAELEERLRRWSAKRALRTAPVTVNPELVRQLRALGYIE